MAMRKSDSDEKAAPPSNAEESVPKKKADSKSPSAPQAARKYDALALTQCARTSAWQYIDNPRAVKMVREGAIDLYFGLEPKNGLEAALSMLLVGVTNSSLDCMSIAARVPPQETVCRELNLRYGLKGAQVAAELAEALNKVRGNASNNVRVGNVNVESGGQAIVGNVSAGGKKTRTPDEAPQKPKKPTA